MLSDHKHFDVPVVDHVTVLRFVEQRLTGNNVVFKVDEELDRLGHPLLAEARSSRRMSQDNTP